MSIELEIFLKNAEEVRFFSNIGKKLDGSIPRINSWSEWPGPDEESVSTIHYRQQDLYEEIVENDNEVQEYWNTLLKFIVERAKHNVPWVDDEDSWYAPNIAVWHAAWTFALLAFCIIKEYSPPQDLRIQWEWFEKGRWPCAIYELKEDEQFRFLIY